MVRGVRSSCDASAANRLARVYSAKGPLPDSEQYLAWLRLAAERVLEFAARVDVARADLYPQIGYEASAGRSKSSLPGGGSLIDNSFLADEAAGL